ncbi:uncharacterized protein L201_001524 [Kwoniella dendrophila CBS 6074]|uniref:Arrestin-like N-terminal domain-containing protein n=1 Tax=Kwoniella dendrophila CBS 6074 TaxID=1295534 RepID=A0AAX4JMI8_9TREE
MFSSSPNHTSSSFRPLFPIHPQSPYNNNNSNYCEPSSSNINRYSTSNMSQHPFTTSSASTSRCASPSSSSWSSPTMPSSPSMSYHSRESTNESVEFSTPSSSPSSSRRRHNNGFWTSLIHHGKNLAREVDQQDDEMMQVDTVADSFSFTPPPSRPICSLSASYQCSETSALIPPSFYPGQSIPVVLTFELDRFSSLPHYLNPTLSMSLIGTLHLPNQQPRTIICVSVSLSEGLSLWARDAKSTYLKNPPKHPQECSIDPDFGLPGGTYSLPLTVQVPTQPRLPPSFTVKSSSFAVTYALTITLSCDDPTFLNTGKRLILADTAKPFEMLPETLPTRSPKYIPQSFYVKSDLPIIKFDTKEDNKSTAVEKVPLPVLPKQSLKWTIHPFLPTTTYSPTSVIPFSIIITPPSLDEFNQPEIQLNLPSEYKLLKPEKYQVLIRLALVRREHSSLSKIEPLDSQGNGLVTEEEIISKWGIFELSSNNAEKLRITDINLPLMLQNENTWKHGMSTMLNVGPSSNGQELGVGVSSTFHLNVTLGFLSISGRGSKTMSDYLPSAFSNTDDLGPINIPKLNEFSEPLKPDHLEYFNIIKFKKSFSSNSGNNNNTIKTLPLPIVIGSVSEPRDALHNIRWSDLHLTRNQQTGIEVGRMIHGESLSSENGWLVPPPSYKDAIKSAPYEYKVEL